MQFLDKGFPANQTGLVLQSYRLFWALCKYDAFTFRGHREIARKQDVKADSTARWN